MTQQDRWWLAISIVWLILTLEMLLYVGFARKDRPSWRPLSFRAPVMIGGAALTKSSSCEAA